MSELKKKVAGMREMPPSSAKKRQADNEEITYNDFYFKNDNAKKTPQTTLNKNASSKARKGVTRRPTPNYSNKLSGVTGGVAVVSANPPVGHKTIRRRKPAVKKIKTRERLSKFDFPFFRIVIILLSMGIVMMFSASYAYSLREHNDSYFYVTRQLGFAAVGVGAMILISFIDYHVLMNKKIIFIGCAISLVLMILVKAGMGVTQGGAERWLNLGGLVLQPSEVLKVAVIILLAYFTQRNSDKIKDFKKGYLPFLLCTLVACGLTLSQPHLSATIIIFSIGVTMMFVGNCRVKHIVAMFAVFAVLGIVGYFGLQAAGYDYFGARFLSFTNPEADPTGDTYQTYQSLVTIGSGGIFGLGLGNSRQKYSHLPATHNDFIFSVICEELGFVGAVLVIALFAIFVYRGFYIAARARDKFGMLLAVGITMQIGVQSLLNIAVASNSVPNTGISLPFFSYGGTALMMQLAEMGIVLNISRKAAIE